MLFTEAEREYLGSQPLARLATVDADGRPQNNPVGFFVNDEAGTIDIRGRRLGKSRKFRNVIENPAVAIVVDDLVSRRPWWVRGIEIRGRAEALTDQQPPYPYYSREIIRIHPERIIAWGIESKDQPMAGRDVES